MQEASKKWQLQFPQEPELPYLYWLPKMHKIPVGQRFIAGSAKVVVSAASKVLCQFLKAIMSALKEKDDSHIAQTGVRRFFIVESFQEVTDFVNKWKRLKGQGLRTFDFSTMYTTLDQDDLIDKIGKVIEEAFSHRTAERLSMSFGSRKPQWLRAGRESHTPKHHTFTMEGLKDLVRYVVKNTYLCNGGKVVHQQVGLPMGTNAAGDLANLYLYFYESRFVDKLIEVNRDKANAWHISFRYIDDFLSVDNPDSAEYLVKPLEEGGMYPIRTNGLNILPSNTDTGHCTYLGLRLSMTGSYIVSKVYDKRASYPFRLRNYPDMRSNIPGSVARGVFTSQLYRFARSCTFALDFVTEAGRLAIKLRRQGYTRTTLCRLYKSFISAHAPIRYRRCKVNLIKTFCSYLPCGI